MDKWNTDVAITRTKKNSIQTGSGKHGAEHTTAHRRGTDTTNGFSDRTERAR